MSEADLVSPVGWLRGIQYWLNGITVTRQDIEDYFDDFDTECECAPGLGYKCPSHE